ncbi:hypothetical protein F5B17DRAFT_420712 [Nemania serpens]|nr:hypothetical protein F5B17DRAFT_420712 [Nemania serpens]
MAEDNLYVVKRTAVMSNDPAELGFKISLPATFTDLKAAKAAARGLLKEEGYNTELLPVYKVNDGASNWQYGDGVLVHAEVPGEAEFEVAIETVQNTVGAKSDSSGRVTTPLFYIVQTMIDYNNERSGRKRQYVVEGAYAEQKVAREQALKILLDEDTKKEDFAEYDEHGAEGDWAFGEEVVVHAVDDRGMNILVSVIQGGERTE